MAFRIREERTDTVGRELASKRGIDLTEAVREVGENELARERKKIPPRERLRPLYDELDAMQRTGSALDKAFHGARWGRKDE
jgi:antitoxin VapB